MFWIFLKVKYIQYVAGQSIRGEAPFRHPAARPPAVRFGHELVAGDSRRRYDP